MTIAVSEPVSPLAAYDSALAFLYGRVDYERQPIEAYGESYFRLDRMRELLARLGSPHVGQKIVHIAGTKGKGSTAAMIASVLSQSGRRTALYTSPHLDRIEERLAIDGESCSPLQLTSLVEKVRPAVEAMDAEATATGRPRPTYFEVTTAMALLHFAQEKVDATVLEVGLGGRLDSTNVCPSLVSVITSISFDHTEQLGDTLAAIAGEKAGIIKPGVPVVSGVEQPEPREVIRRQAESCGSRLVELGRDFSFIYRPPRDLQDQAGAPRFDYCDLTEAQPPLVGVELGLIGGHQGANAAVAVAALGELRRLGWRISDESIRRGLAAARFPARVEIVRRRPTVVVDAAHNVAAIEALLATLAESFGNTRRIAIFATTRQKDYVGMLQRLLPAFDAVVFTRYLNNPRGIPPEELAEAARQLGASGYATCATPVEAWEAAMRLAGGEASRAGALICVTGSFFIAAEIRQIERDDRAKAS